MPPKLLSEYFARIGRKGGKARVKNLTAERRSKIARKAVEARWDRYRAARKAGKVAPGGPIVETKREIAQRSGLAAAAKIWGNQTRPSEPSLDRVLPGKHQTLGNAIRRIREGLPWVNNRPVSQRDFAERFGVNSINVNKWERGVFIPALPSLIKLAVLAPEGADYQAFREALEARGLSLAALRAVSEVIE